MRSSLMMPKMPVGYLCCCIFDVSNDIVSSRAVFRRLMTTVFPTVQRELDTI